MVNVYMDPLTRAMLEDLARRWRLSESATIRTLIARAYSDARRRDA